MTPPLEPGHDGSEIAIVGMSGRFPGAPDLDAFWRNLAGGVESVRFFSEEELLRAGETRETIEDPAYVRARPVLTDVESFDAAFFGFTPREAEVLDPQARLFLECAFSALEHAGRDLERFEGRASLFAGASFSNYLVHNLYQNRPAMEAFGDLQATIFNVQDALVTMVGYKLNLKGACCAVQTFCSTSLVGVHLACQNLLNYESDLALAGGVTVYVPQTSGYKHEDGSIVSRDGHCRAFDARADGTVFGSGVGVVVLRRLADALKDGDTVHAVIRGSAVNNDGSLKVSFAAPGVVGQTEVVVEALSAADVHPETIGYVEAHGTGTRLGDPAEVSALTNAFRTRTAGRGFCALGSVKTNVGHLDAAAGVAGLIKVALALQHRQIPPSLHFETPNPTIDFASSPFFVNTSLREWPRLRTPRRAGVSAFGVGGTNAHLIVEEAPAVASEPSKRPVHLLVLSAKTESALEASTRALAARLEAGEDLPLADVAYTLQLGRCVFAHRRAVVCRTRAEAVAGLKREGAPSAVADRRNPPVVLVIHPQDARALAAWHEMGLSAPALGDALEACRKAAGGSLDEAGPALATLVAGYAVGRLWQAWGVRFEAHAGEGMGTLPAACLAGAMDLEEAVRVARQHDLGGDALAACPALADRDRASVARTLPADTARLYLEMGTGDHLSLLEGLGRLWLAGVEPDWAAVHAPERRRRVPLPTYPFERQRYWIDPLDKESVAAGERDPAEWLYRPVWKAGLPLAKEEAHRAARSLVFVDSRGLGAKVVERLRAAGGDVITVAAGSSSDRGQARYTIDPADAREYSSLWDDLRAREWRPDRILHFWGVDRLDPSASGADRFRRASGLGFYSLLRLAAARPEGALVVTAVSTGVHEVVGGEVLEPEKAPALALLRVLAQEEHDLRCVSIDVDWTEGDAAGLEALADELEATEGEPVVALRRGRRWVPEFDRIPRAVQERGLARLRPGGVYLITGGLGDVGFMLGVLLAGQARPKLFLTGRRGLPSREAWNAWLETHPPAEETAVRMRKVQALEALGAEVVIHPADASDAGAMRAAVVAARERFGALHGVIHAAGELSPEAFGAARTLETAACERQFAPKVHGLLALEAAVADQALDFCALTSSVSSVLGGIGYGAYAAANAFMDAFAVERSRSRPGVFVSIDWDQWEFAGRSRGDAARQAARQGATLKPEEGIAVFERILRLRGLERVLVSTEPLEARLARWAAPAPVPASAAGPATRPRPNLGHPYVAPASPAEVTLAVIWQELLGIDAVGRDDDFFALGGHSLFAARVLSRVRAAFGVSLPLEAVFAAPTVAGLAARLDAANAGARRPTETRTDRVEIEI